MRTLLTLAATSLLSLSIVAQDFSLVRKRVAWLGDGKDPVLAEACIGWGRPKKAPARSDVEAAGRSVIGHPECIARLDVFPEFFVGKVKVPSGQYAVLLEPSDDGLALALVEGEVLTSSDPAAAALAAEVKYRLPLTPVAPKNAADKSMGFEFIVQQPDQEASDARLRLNLGGEAFETMLTFPKMKRPPFIPEGDRSVSRLLVDGRPIAHLDHGRVKWSNRTEEALGRLRNKSRWRIGANWWTSLDTTAAMQLGGVEVPAGRWHLVLVRGKKKQDWQLACLPVADTLRAGLDALSAETTKGGVLIPLTHADGQPQADDLSITFVGDAPDRRLEIRFGEFLLTATASEL